MPTPSPERVRAVLDDLYVLDPALREYGPDLEGAVRTLLTAKPESDINPQFAAALRTRLMQQAAPQTVRTSSMPTPNRSLWFLLPTAVVAVAAVVVAVVLTNPSLMHLSTSGQPTAAPSGQIAYAGLTVTKSGDHSFGDLSQTTPGNGADGKTGMGGGGVAAQATAPVPPMQPMADGATPEQESAMAAKRAVGSDAMIAPYPGDNTYQRTRYVYNGTLPSIPASVDVYRRNTQAIGGLGNALSGASLGFIDLSKFNGTSLQQFTLTTSGPDGYQIYVDLNGGTVSINQDWNTWPQAAPQPCTPEGPCGGQVATSDVPDDATITGIADAFLSAHGISKDGYGAPVVDRRWNVVQPYMKDTPGMLTPDLKVRWAPNTINVVYPIQINGMTAYDSSGFPYGLSVTVDVQVKKVASVWNITNLNYQSSSYDAMTDSKTILDIASRGDLYSTPFGQDPNERLVDEALGDPTMVLMQSWHTAANGTGEEILVPALRFPVVSSTNDYRDAVMVPLVKELVEPQVIMYMKGAAGSGSAGSGIVMPPNATAPVPTVPPATEPAPNAAPQQ